MVSYTLFVGLNYILTVCCSVFRIHAVYITLHPWYLDLENVNHMYGKLSCLANFIGIRITLLYCRKAIHDHQYSLFDHKTVQLFLTIVRLALLALLKLLVGFMSKSVYIKCIIKYAANENNSLILPFIYEQHKAFY